MAERQKGKTNRFIYKKITHKVTLGDGEKIIYDQFSPPKNKEFTGCIPDYYMIYFLYYDTRRRATIY